METRLRAALLDWLGGDPVIAEAVNIIDEAETSRAALPWLALVSSASADWSSKTHSGREIRLAVELRHRGDVPGQSADLLRRIETRIESLPGEQPAYRIVTAHFLRARHERRSGNARASLIEYRFRCLAA